VSLQYHYIFLLCIPEKEKKRKIFRGPRVWATTIVRPSVCRRKSVSHFKAREITFSGLITLRILFLARKFLGLVSDFFLGLRRDSDKVTEESDQRQTKVRQKRIFGVRQNEFFSLKTRKLDENSEIIFTDFEIF
jgi:hypothetical protein